MVVVARCCIIEGQEARESIGKLVSAENMCRQRRAKVIRAKVILAQCSLERRKTHVGIEGSRSCPMLQKRLVECNCSSKKFSKRYESRN